jgi:hypothetical protein
MRFIEIDLNGTVVRASLNDDLAPRTCQAIWDALPFEGRAVHAQISGDMFRMLDHAPIPDLAVESGVSFQHPGQVIYYPGIKEIAFCTGLARFRGAPGADGAVGRVTPLAEIEGDFSAFAKIGYDLQFDGARPIRFRKAADQETPFRYPGERGRKIAVEVDGVTLTATLLEELAPMTTAAFANKLPIAGRITNTAWSGDITRFWGPVGPEGELGLDVTEPENGKNLHWPGYIYYYAGWKGIRICYGDNGCMGGPWGAATLTPLARFDGDWDAFRQIAKSLFIEGAKPMSFRLLDAAD